MTEKAALLDKQSDLLTQGSDTNTKFFMVQNECEQLKRQLLQLQQNQLPSQEAFADK